MDDRSTELSLLSSDQTAAPFLNLMMASNQRLTTGRGPPEEAMQQSSVQNPQSRPRSSSPTISVSSTSSQQRRARFGQPFLPTTASRGHQNHHKSEASHQRNPTPDLNRAMGQQQQEGPVIGQPSNGRTQSSNQVPSKPPSNTDSGSVPKSTHRQAILIPDAANQRANCLQQQQETESFAFAASSNSKAHTYVVWLENPHG
ncbi:hypothetical protein ACLOJK_018862 [Asimina triloba]